MTFTEAKPAIDNPSVLFKFNFISICRLYFPFEVIEFVYYIAVTARSCAPTDRKAEKEFVLVVFRENGVEKEATVPTNWIT